jgi:nucleoside-diphosphate-sugar epimerase
MTALTGATGFLGRYLAEELLRRGHRVRALVRDARRLRVQGLEVVEGDVNDVTALEEAFDGAQTVIHNAAMVSFMKSRREAMRKTNAGGTENAVNVALETGVKRFVYVGSVAALGRPPSSAVLDETARWTDSPCNTYYGYTKYLAEKHVYRGREEGLNAVIVHPATILGYGEDNHGSPALFFRAQRGSRICPAGGTGFVAAEDVARAVALLAETDRYPSERYILSAENLSYLELFKLMNRAFGHRPPTRTAPPAFTYLYGLWHEFIATMTGKESVVTRESARTAGGLYRYDGTRITRDFEFRYTPVAQTIERVAARMQRPKKQNF